MLDGYLILITSVAELQQFFFLLKGCCCLVVLQVLFVSHGFLLFTTSLVN